MRHTVAPEVRRRSALAFYYLVAWHLPTQPRPGWRVAYCVRRALLRWIIPDCGVGVIVKQHCYLGSATGLRVGANSQLGENARIDQHVTIGDDVVMGPDAYIQTNAHAFEDPDTPVRLQGGLPNRPVRVGNDVWIGARVVILPGVSVGDGAVIGVGAIVTRDVPPMSIVAGNPARVIRRRGERPSVERAGARIADDQGAPRLEPRSERLSG